MKNITLAIDEELLARARALAASQHTSLNAMVRSLLSHEVEQDARIARVKAGLGRLMDESALDMGAGYRWNRQEIYDEREDRLLSRHQRPDLRSADKDEG